MMQLSRQIFLFTTIYTVISANLEDHSFPSLSLSKAEQSGTESSFIKKLDYLANILKPKDIPLSISERLYASVKIIPSGSVKDGDNKHFSYTQLRKGTYPDMLYKRARSGFVGMRGKKDGEFLENGQNFGTFDMREKKYPFEFRGKFVGVRGKKVYLGKPENRKCEVNLKQKLDPNQMMLVLTEQNSAEN